MRFFEQLNKTGEPCAICGTHDDGRGLLIPRTDEIGVVEAVQIHAHCAHRVAQLYVMANEAEHEEAKKRVLENKNAIEGVITELASALEKEGD